jgi:hypothetical protein
VLVRKSGTEEMSEDHKPFNDVEKRRIEGAGGSVTMRRVNGDLAVSRALGDFVYKHRSDLPAEAQQVSAEPEIKIVPRSPDDQVRGQAQALRGAGGRLRCWKKGWLAHLVKHHARCVSGRANERDASALRSSPAPRSSPTLLRSTLSQPRDSGAPLCPVPRIPTGSSARCSSWCSLATASGT